LRAGNADDEATPSAVIEKRSHGGRKIGLNLFTALPIPHQRRVFAEDGSKLRRIFDGDWRMQRTRGRETDKDRDIHTRQAFGKLRRFGFEAKSRQSADDARDHNQASPAAIAALKRNKVQSIPPAVAGGAVGTDFWLHSISKRS
jgi:hypothetical protein